MFLKMLSYLKPYKKPFLIGQIAMLVGTAAGLAFPWAVRRVFDTLFVAGNMSVLLTAVGLLAGVFALREVANYAKTVTLDSVGQNVIRDLRDRLYHKLLELSLDYYDNKSSGEITSSMTNDINLVQGGLASGLAYILQQVLTLVGVTVLLVRMDWALTLTIFATIPIVILISKTMGDKIRSIATSTQERLAHLTNIISESVAGIDIIKAFVLEHNAKDLFRGQNNQILSKSLRSIRVTANARLIIGLLNSLFTLIVIGLGGYRVARGVLTPPDLIAFILYAEMVVGPVAMLAGLYIEINKALAAFGRINDILDTPNVIRSESTLPLPGPTQPVSGNLVFQDVAFSYDGHNNVLHDINLIAAPGETIALVGPSGVGKSTLVKLIPRFYDPTAGHILFDGLDSQDLNVEFLRSQIAIVPQDTYLFGMSIYENIACGRPDATEDEIVRAAQLANAHEFILEQPNGYHTQIGERGARLSGGQRQRIAIARAFLKDPRILILDEATSALDTHSERRVQDALDKLMRGRTTIIIAHRLSTIENASKIVVLQQGTVLATGTHRELLARCDIYNSLYRTQFASAATLQTVPPPVLAPAA
ncbi:MAG: ABC transporter ATP-binding protein [Anaerolineae bacterium]|nr:ABC transporter ATP-binding protein [Anaerolineae bacterium]